MRWSEPAVWRERPRGATISVDVLGLGGLEQLNAIGERPGMYHLTGTTFDAARPREAEFSMPVTGWLRSPQGAVPGGLLAVPADGALGCAIHSDLRPGTAYTTAELSITYLRSLRLGSRVRALGRALHVGSTLAFSTCEVTDDAGRLMAYATSRCSVFSTGSPPSRGGTAKPAALGTDGDAPTDPRDPFLREPAGSVIEQAVWDSRSGIDVLSAQRDGALPQSPLHHLLGIAVVDVGESRAECVMPLTGWLATPWGWPQGGFIAALADIALGMAVQTTVAAGTAFAPVDLKVNFLRPASLDGLLHARAEVVHRGRSLAVATVRVTDDDGRVVALAGGSAQILPGRPAALGSDG